MGKGKNKKCVFVYTEQERKKNQTLASRNSIVQEKALFFRVESEKER